MASLCDAPPPPPPTKKEQTAHHRNSWLFRILTIKKIQNKVQKGEPLLPTDYDFSGFQASG